MNEPWEDYRRLRDRVLDGNADEAEMRQLEKLVTDHEAFKRDYVEHAHLEATLIWQNGNATPPITPLTEPVRRPASTYPRRLVFAVAATALLAIGFAWLLTNRRSNCATLVSTENCVWGESTLATLAGQPLVAGRLRLLQGIAHVRFPKVDVTLEGPVDFEVMDARSCFVHSGRVHSVVHPGGEGFVIETPSAVLLDRGTEFGVNVLPSGVSDLRVFNGLVDATHSKTGAQFSVTTDNSVRLTMSGIERLAGVVEPAFAPQETTDASGLKSIQISTAVGVGADAYVSPEPLPPESCMTTALLAKRPPIVEGSWAVPWRRKAMMSFDLSLLTGEKIADAKLQLTGVATNIGYAALIPDATFSVFGLTDESEEDWTEDELRWDNSPGQVGNQLDLDPSKVVLLGQFVVPQSQPTGVFSIAGPELVEFLRGDTNGKTTLIVIPETVGTGACYVHGFASKRHPELPPPTLRLNVLKSKRE